MSVSRPGRFTPVTHKRPVDPTADLGDLDNSKHPDPVGTLTPSSLATQPGLVTIPTELSRVTTIFREMWRMSYGECLVPCKDVRRAARQLYLLCCRGVELGAREQLRLRVQVAENWRELQNGQLNGLYTAPNGAW